MTWLEIMVNRALNDPYLNELTRKLELKYAHNFLYQKDDIVLTEKEFDDVLRFADILSRSSEAEGETKRIRLSVYCMMHIKMTYSFSIMQIQY